MKNLPDVPRDSFAPFPSTSWTLVTNLQQLSAEKRRVLFNEWIIRYWKPLYSYFRSKRQSPEQAADLVQGFLERFLEGDRILQADNPEKRFRDWLRVSARNFLISELRKEKAAMRRPPLGIVSFERLRLQDGDPYEPAAESTPEMVFVDAWRRDLLDRVLRSVSIECEARGRSTDFQVFCDYYVNELGGKVSWKDVASRHGLPEWRSAVHAADWVKSKLGDAIRREVRSYVDSEEEVEAEVRALLS